MVFSALVLQFLSKKISKRKKKDDTFLKKKNRKEKQNRVTVMISVDGKRTVFLVKLKLQGE